MNPERYFRYLCKATSVALFFLILVCARPAVAEPWRVRVDKVVDGDTVVLQDGRSLRLRGIDAPEVRHGDRPGQYYGRQAAMMLGALVSGRMVTLDRAELSADRYGRLVGRMRLSDGREVATVMVEEGCAFVYPHQGDDPELMALLLAAQVRAMNAARGFWPRILAVPTSGGYVGSRAARHVHARSCAQGRTVAEKNRVIFATLRDAFAAGWSPARECTPWPEAIE